MGDQLRRARPMLGNGPLTSHHLCSLFVASAPLIENQGGSVSQGVRWIALTCSALSLMLEFSAGAVARECREIQAGWWHNQPFLGTKFSKQHFNECTRKYRKENWKVFDVSGPNCQPSSSKQRSARPETAIDECGGDGGDPSGRFFCATKATACSPRN